MASYSAEQDPFDLDPLILARHALADWLNFVDCLFESYGPECDLTALSAKVLAVALNHPDWEMRKEALAQLSHGFEKHRKKIVSLKPLAEVLAQREGQEFLMAMNAIGLSADAALARWVRPFLTHEDKLVRVDAQNCLREMGLEC
jgi:hypothetical protein